MITETAKIKNGTITLPRELRKAWQGADVFVFPNEDTLIIKKVPRPLPRLSDVASRVSARRISQKEIEKEIQSYRRNK